MNPSSFSLIFVDNASDSYYQICDFFRIKINHGSLSSSHIKLTLYQVHFLTVNYILTEWKKQEWFMPPPYLTDCTDFLGPERGEELDQLFHQNHLIKLLILPFSNRVELMNQLEMAREGEVSTLMFDRIYYFFNTQTQMPAIPSPWKEVQTSIANNRDYIVQMWEKPIQLLAFSSNIHDTKLVPLKLETIVDRVCWTGDTSTIHQLSHWSNLSSLKHNQNSDCFLYYEKVLWLPEGHVVTESLRSAKSSIITEWKRELQSNWTALYISDPIPKQYIHVEKEFADDMNDEELEDYPSVSNYYVLFGIFTPRKLDMSQMLVNPNIGLIDWKALHENTPSRALRKNMEEEQYYQTLREILLLGAWKCDRTGTGTLSISGKEARYNLSENRLPMLTTRPIALRYAVEELNLFLRGQTDATILEKKNIFIWKEHTSRAFLDKRGLTHLKEGDMSAGSYSHCMRAFGSDYEDCEKSYIGEGVDQLMEAVKLLKTDPQSRRILVLMWDPKNSPHKAALSPCHVLIQLLVNHQGYLDLIFTMRSNDWLCGHPLNILEYAIMNRYLAIHCGFKPGHVIYHGGDVHMYASHINQACEQLCRGTFDFPIVNIKGDVGKSVESFEYGDFAVENYQHGTRIKYVMTV